MTSTSNINLTTKAKLKNVTYNVLADLSLYTGRPKTENK